MFTHDTLCYNALSDVAKPFDFVVQRFCLGGKKDEDERWLNRASKAKKNLPE